MSNTATQYLCYLKQVDRSLHWNFTDHTVFVACHRYRHDLRVVRTFTSVLHAPAGQPLVAGPRYFSRTKELVSRRDKVRANALSMNFRKVSSLFY